MKPVSSTWTAGSALGVAAVYLGSVGLYALYRLYRTHRWPQGAPHTVQVATTI